MKCEVFWTRRADSSMVHAPRAAEATHLSVGSPLDDSTGNTPVIFAVCEEHADLGRETGGWVKITPHVARHIGQMEEALRLAP